MKRFFGKRRATRMVPGGLKTQPFGRLGPLVFQLNNSDKLCWASLRAPTRIAGCALSLRPNSHPLGRRFPEKSLNSQQLPGAIMSASPKYLRSVFRFVPWLRSNPKNPDGRLRHRRDRIHPQSTDELSAQVALLLQSPILSVVPLTNFSQNQQNQLK